MWSNAGLDVGGSTGGKNDQLLDGVRPGSRARLLQLAHGRGSGSGSAAERGGRRVRLQRGGVLNLSMKSGTNDYHGTGYWFGRNPYFNAVVDPITRTPSVVKNNIWGGTVGGPIKKNKLFNFFVYEQWKATQPSSNVSTVPTDLERGGDFSRTLTPSGALRTIYDPFSTKFDPATSTVT
jgi:hypothetical protein